MPWPLSQDYNEAIQSPEQCFADAELRQAEARCNPLGLPMPRSGNFADVYELLHPDGRKWAVKCFTRQVAGLRDRYAAISAHLKQASLKFMVDFTYLDQGIKVAGQWYPILKMDWVEGLTLNECVKEHADNASVLENLCQLWVRLARKLREAQMAHCDLQHGNVLLVPGNRAGALSVKLIDYDGLFVPALANQRSGEVGHPAYQHPQRLRDGTYGIEVDRFPHLVILTALRALIAGGRSLWNRHDNGDNLLFRQTDLQAPGDSPLVQELLKTGDEKVRRLTEALSQAAVAPLEQTPLLDQLVDAGEITTKPRRTGVVAVGVAPPPVAAAAPAPVPVPAPPAAPLQPAAAPAARKWRGLYKGGIAAGFGIVVAAIAAGIVPLIDRELAGDKSNPVAATPGPEASADEPSKPPAKVKEPDPPKPPPTKPERLKPPPINPDPEPPKPPPAKPAPKKTWPLLDTSDADAIDDFLRITGTRMVRTVDSYAGPVEIVVTARTDRHNLHVEAYQGASITFNSTADHKVLRIRRPDGGSQPESGTLVIAPVKPLRVNAWHTLRWRISYLGMEVWAGKQLVFSEKRIYDLRSAQPVRVSAKNATIDVRSLVVKPLPGSPVPDAVAQAGAEKRIRALFQADYAKRQPGELTALGDKLLKQASGTPNDPVARFVLWREARDLFVQAGHPERALPVIDLMGRDFPIDTLEMKIIALERAGPAMAKPDQVEMLARQGLLVCRQAVVADAYPAAERTLKVADAAAAGSKNAALSSEVQTRRKELAVLKTEYARVQPAVQTLATRPGDASANAAVGKFLCLWKADWTKGLPLLAKGNDSSLQSLAQKETTAPTAPDKQAELAKGWWDWAQKQETGSLVQENVQNRARYWYRRALPGLGGLAQTEASDRLKLMVGSLELRPGLVAEYFQGTNFDHRRRSRIDYRIDFPWNGGRPDKDIDGMNFSARWLGWLKAPQPGTYTLVVFADDGVIVRLDNKPIIRHWSASNMAGRRTATVQLTDKPHLLEVYFVQGGGASAMHLSWAQEGGFSERIIPLGALYHDQAQREILTFDYKAYAGRWQVQYANKGVREYLIDASGGVSYPQGKIGGSLMIGPNRDMILWMRQLERVRLVIGRLHVDHYNPWQSYPFGKAITTGTAIRK
jgi:hypothetical protein